MDNHSYFQIKEEDENFNSEISHKSQIGVDFHSEILNEFNYEQAHNNTQIDTSNSSHQNSKPFTQLNFLQQLKQGSYMPINNDHSTNVTNISKQYLCMDQNNTQQQSISQDFGIKNYNFFNQKSQQKSIQNISASSNENLENINYSLGNKITKQDINQNQDLNQNQNFDNLNINGNILALNFPQYQNNYSLNEIPNMNEQETNNNLKKKIEMQEYTIKNLKEKLEKQQNDIFNYFSNLRKNEVGKMNIKIKESFQKQKDYYEQKIQNLKNQLSNNLSQFQCDKSDSETAKIIQNLQQNLRKADYNLQYQKQQIIQDANNQIQELKKHYSNIIEMNKKNFQAQISDYSKQLKHEQNKGKQQVLEIEIKYRNQITQMQKKMDQQKEAFENRLKIMEDKIKELKNITIESLRQKILTKKKMNPNLKIFNDDEQNEVNILSYKNFYGVKQENSELINQNSLKNDQQNEQINENNNLNQQKGLRLTNFIQDYQLTEEQLENMKFPKEQKDKENLRKLYTQFSQEHFIQNLYNVYNKMQNIENDNEGPVSENFLQIKNDINKILSNSYSDANIDRQTNQQYINQQRQSTSTDTMQEQQIFQKDQQYELFLEKSQTQKKNIQGFNYNISDDKLQDLLNLYCSDEIENSNNIFNDQQNKIVNEQENLDKISQKSQNYQNIVSFSSSSSLISQKEEKACVKNQQQKEAQITQNLLDESDKKNQKFMEKFTTKNQKLSEEMKFQKINSQEVSQHLDKNNIDNQSQLSSQKNSITDKPILKKIKI